MSNRSIASAAQMNLGGMITQCTSDSKRWFPQAQDMPNLVLCIAGEVGEVANIVKKVTRGSLRMEDAMETLPEEIVDILIYLVNLMGHDAFDEVNWKKVWDDKRNYNRMRFQESGSSNDVRHPSECLGDVPEDISPREDVEQ